MYFIGGIYSVPYACARNDVYRDVTAASVGVGGWVSGLLQRAGEGTSGAQLSNLLFSSRLCFFFYSGIATRFLENDRTRVLDFLLDFRCGPREKNSQLLLVKMSTSSSPQPEPTIDCYKHRPNVCEERALLALKTRRDLGQARDCLQEVYPQRIPSPHRTLPEISQ